MSIKVSVVVPVYNAGAYLSRCTDSIVAQTMPSDEWEAIFVDDGSTDGSGDALDAVARRHPNIRVIHQENSGWPGRPRNVGLDAARGEYVYFADSDDKVGREALARLHAMAVRTGADIVLGKIVGHKRGAPRDLFVANRDQATLWDTPLMDSLTVQKLFRRSMLEANGIRFREGRRRLEDHVFVLEAYFAARSIAVLSDYSCYHAFWRADEGNISRGRPDPAYYYRFLREAIAVVEANTEPGERRDQLLTRFARVELVDRLRGARFLAEPPEHQAALFDEVRSVVLDHIGPGVDANVEPRYRTMLALIRADRLDLVRLLSREEATIGATAEVTNAAWRPDGRLAVTITARQTGSTAAFAIEQRDGSALMTVPPAVADAVAAEMRRADRIGTGRVNLRRTRDSADIALPASVEARAADIGTGPARAELTLVAEVDPERLVRAGAARGGTWEVVVRVQALGITRDAAATGPGAGALEARIVRAARRRVRIAPLVTPSGRFALRVEPIDARFVARRVLRRIPGRMGELVRATLGPIRRVLA